MKILALAASLREGSHNRKLLRLATRIAEGKGASVTTIPFSDLVVPYFNQDVLDNEGFPEEIERFCRMIDESDGFIISSPEYNFSIPGTLKNTIDWVSRKRPVPFRGKTALLLSASTSQVGGIRGLWQLRIPLEGNGVIVHPDMYALPTAPKMFDDEGELLEESRVELLEKMVSNYIGFVTKLAPTEKK